MTNEPIPVSQWYPALGAYTFPTLFVSVDDDAATALVDGLAAGPAIDGVTRAIDRAIDSLPGSCFVHADVCAPSDAATFEKTSGSVRSGIDAWQLLCESDKVRSAFRDGHTRTRRLGIHSYRRMDRVREFRMFFKDGTLRAVSQLNLTRHFGRLAKKQELVWNLSKGLAAEISGFLPRPDITVDVYLTSRSDLMIIDMNPWGPPTAPLLMREWDRDWDCEIGLKLIPKPTRLGGDVEVSV